MNTSAGKFIVIEGIDGAGTTTQSRLLCERLNARGQRAVLTAEPTTGPVGTLIRQILSGRLLGRRPDGTAPPVGNDTIALLFAADRLDHLECEVEPWVAAGAWVISDRYYHSSLLYQSLEGDLDWIRILNARARRPDVTYVLDIDVEQALARRSGRASAERYEVDSVQRQLVSGYRGLGALLREEEIVLIDGRESADRVLERITLDLGRRFEGG